MKLAPQLLRSLARAPKIEMCPCYRNLVTVLAVWSGVIYANTCFVKWSWNTRMLATLGGWFSSMVISMLVKSKCKWSNRAVAIMGCRGTLGKWPSCCKQCTQDLMDCCIWLIIPSYQKCSHSNDKVWSWPWWPASLWHPFRAVTEWALGTTNNIRSSVSPLGIECRYKAPWWIAKLCQFHKISWPSSLEVCSTRSAFKSICLPGPSASLELHSTVGPPLWASAQSITCICTSACDLQQHAFLSPS